MVWVVRPVSLNDWCVKCYGVYSGAAFCIVRICEHSRILQSKNCFMLGTYKGDRQLLYIIYSTLITFFVPTVHTDQSSHIYTVTGPPSRQVSIPCEIMLGIMIFLVYAK